MHLGRLAVGLALLTGCVSAGNWRIEMDSPIRPGQTLRVAEMSVGSAFDLVVRISNRGPDPAGPEDCDLEIRNGDDVLGLLRAGEEGTFTVSGSSLNLIVRSIGGATRFEGTIVAKSR